MTGTLTQPSVLKDIAIGILLSLIIIAMMYTIPLIGILAWMILPLPVLFYRLKTGRQGGAVIMAASLAVLIVLTQHLIFNVLYFGSLLLTGFLLGETIERHLGIEKIMIYTGIAVFGMCLLVFIFISMTKAQGPGSMVTDYLNQYQALSSELFSQSAQMYPDLHIDLEVLEKARTLFMVIFPAIFINSYFTMVWINILCIKRMLNSRGIKVASIENLRQWKAPEPLIFGVIALSLLLFMPLGAFKWVAFNGLLILMFVYFFQGIAVVSYYFEKKQAPVALRFFFYLLIAFQPLFLILVISCGLFDTWFNFRKLETTV